MAAGSSIEYAETKRGATSSRKKATSGERDLVMGDAKLLVLTRCGTWRSPRAKDPKFLRISFSPPHLSSLSQSTINGFSLDILNVRDY